MQIQVKWTPLGLLWLLSMHVIILMQYKVSNIIFIINFFKKFFGHCLTIFIYIATLNMLQSLKETKEKNWKKIN